MSALEQLEQAHGSAQPAEAYRTVIQELSRDGWTSSQIYTELERFLASLRKRSEHRAEDEEGVLDVMDALTGWCHPDARLLPDEKTL